MESTLLIRADASSGTGIGHVMRCLALAQAWVDAGGRVVHVAAELDPALEGQLRKNSIEVARISNEAAEHGDARETVAIARGCGAQWVVVDGYQFGADFQRAVKGAGFRLLFVDDYGHAGEYYADLVLNQNIHADGSLYVRRLETTRLLLNLRYLLLRREFRVRSGWRREAKGAVSDLLVTLGGADPDNATLMVLKAVQRLNLPGLRTTVVVGGSNPHFESIESLARSCKSVCVIRNAENMPDLMADADLAVVGAGTTAWEAAFMGLPSLGLVLAENQIGVARGLSDCGAAMDLGWANRLAAKDMADAIMDLCASAPKRAQMTGSGRQLIDGRGVSRVLTRMREPTLRFRGVTGGDCHQLWEWANDRGTRAASFSPELIPWERHTRWFHSSLASATRTMYIVSGEAGDLIGTVRFDRATPPEASEESGKRAVISIALAPDARGKGYGAAVIRRATQMFLNASDVEVIDAYIKPDNAASLGAFALADYAGADSVVRKGQAAIRMSHRNVTADGALQ